MEDPRAHTLDRMGIATLRLDGDLRIRECSERAASILGLGKDPLNRGLDDAHASLGPALRDLVRESRSERSLVEREIGSDKGGWYVARAAPDGREGDQPGVDVVLVDARQPLRARVEAERAREFAETIVQTLHEPLLVLGEGARVHRANRAFFEHFRLSREQTVGRRVYDLANGQWDVPRLHELLEQALPSRGAVTDFEVRHSFEGLGERVLLINARRFESQGLVALGIRDATEAKRDEDALRLSEGRLRSMLNIPGVAILRFNENGTLIAANDAFLDMTGHSRQQIERRTLTWRDLTPPEHVQTTERELEQLHETGRIGPYEKEYFHADGSRSWMLLAGASLGDGTFVKYCLDITDRKAADRALRESEDSLRRSEERLRAMVNIPAVGVLRFDLGGTLLDANDAFLEMAGFSRRRVEQRTLTWRDLTPPEYRELTQRQLAQLDETGRIGPYEKEYFHADGSRSWMLMAGASLGDGTFVKYCLDITDRKAAERALRESEERYRLLVESAREYAIFMLDMEGNIVSWSAGAQRVFGYTDEEVLGKPGEMLFSEEDRRAGVPRAEMNAAARDGSASDDRWHVRKDGSRFWAGGVLTSLFESGPHGYAKVLRDNTRQKEHNEQLQTLMAELNHRVKNTLAVVQSIARQSLRRAPNLATFGRDFEQRLRSIAQAHSLLTRDNWRGAPLARIIENELGEARAAADLPSAGGGTTIVSAGPAITLEPRVALSLHMIIHELATNARKYGALAAADGRLELAWRLLPREGEERDDLELDWTEQVRRPIEPPTSVGFGSQLIDQLVGHELQGAIERSYEPDGLRCRIRVAVRRSLRPWTGSAPAVPTPAALVMPEIVTTPTETEKLTPHGKPARLPAMARVGPIPPMGPTPPPAIGRVLVVEDLGALAMAMCEHLESCGYTVIGPAATLAQAISLAESARPSAAVLDVNLGDEQIFPLLPILRQAGVPFVLVTGHDAATLPAEHQDAPVLSKPVNVDHVERFLRAHC